MTPRTRSRHSLSNSAKSLASNRKSAVPNLSKKHRTGARLPQLQPLSDQSASQPTQVASSTSLDPTSCSPPLPPSDSRNRDENMSDHRSSGPTEQSDSSNLNRSSQQPSLLPSNLNSSTISNPTPVSTVTQDGPNTPPTLDNLDRVLKFWPIARIRAVLAGKQKSGGNVPADVLAEAKLAQRVYHKKRLMLAMIGHTSEHNLKKHLGESGAPREADRYRRFLSFNKNVLALDMPAKGVSDSTLSRRNVQVGKIWESYSEDQKQVYHCQYFFALAGVPNLSEIQEPKADGSPPNIPCLSTSDDNHFRPIYEELVAHEKVLIRQGRSKSLKSLNKRSLLSARQLIKLIDRDAHRLEFGYLFIAASRHPPSKKTGGGWSLHHSSLPTALEWADNQIGLSSVFAATTQGKAMLQAIEEVRGKKRKRSAPGQVQACDAVKHDLTFELNDLLKRTVGYLPFGGFPKTENPREALVRKKIPARIILDEGAKITESDLQVGFSKMWKQVREKWLDDIRSGKFTLQLLEVDDTRNNLDGDEVMEGTEGTEATRKEKGNKNKRPQKNVESNEEADEEEESDESDEGDDDDLETDDLEVFDDDDDDEHED